MRLFDLHCDTIGEATDRGEDIRCNSCCIDLCRGRRFDMWTQAFAIWLPDGLSVEAAQHRCGRLLDTAGRWMAEIPSFHGVYTSADLDLEWPTCRAVLAIENGGALAPHREELSSLYARGVRLVTLTWNGDNYWGSGCGGTSGERLTPAGVQAVRDLEKLGMVVDVSHLNAAGFWQVARMATRPFIASHSNASAVHPHCRNLSDEQFRAIRDSGGVVGLNLYGEHLGGWSFAALRRHLEHFLSLNGEETLCFGTDFDGMPSPTEWEGMTVMERLWQYLADSGYSQELLDAVFYKNACRFFQQALEKN